MPSERVQKLIAQSGIASRRGAEELIASGRVAINGQPAGLGARADPVTDAVTIDGRPIGHRERTVHIAVHKPRGLLSSTRDERGRRSVLAVLGADVASFGRLWPAGRLDADSEGLMLLTNDGAWANRVLHPRYGLEREYAVLVDPEPDAGTLRALRAGVDLEDGPARLLNARRAVPPREVRRDPGERGSWLRVRVGEGRKREVRRIFEAAGHQVRRLARTALGPLTVEGLEVGEWRALDTTEVAALAGAGPAHAASRAGLPERRGGHVQERRGGHVQEPRGGHVQERRASGRAALAVAIDGPSGAGKSTVGHALAVRIGANFVDTGLMYRALTLAAIEQRIDPDDALELGRLARRSRIHVRRPRPGETERLETVLLGRRDVTAEVRTPRIDRLVSSVSRHAEVRRAMVGVQRDTARRGPTVMVGRDIGTVVLPHASLKVFLTASTDVRAHRRAAEMGRPDRVAQYRAEIAQRDEADSGRAVAPLRKAAHALVLDTGELDVDACVERIVAALPAPRAAG